MNALRERERQTDKDRQRRTERSILAGREKKYLMNLYNNRTNELLQ